MKSIRLFILAVVLSGGLTVPAHASSILFSDRAAFDAAVGQSTLLTFDSSPTQEFSTVAPYIWSLTFDALLTTEMNDIEYYQGGTMVFDGDFCFCSFIGTGLSLYTLTPVLAFGADITPLSNIHGPEVTIKFADQTISLTQPQFIGIVYTAPTMLSIGSTFQIQRPTTGTFSIDNVAIKPTNTVPEPAYWIGLPFIMLAMFFAHRRAA